MSIVFRPAIPISFRQKESFIPSVTKSPVTNKRPAKLWTTSTLAALVELRALAVPYNEIGLFFERRPADCAGAVNRHSLQLAIRNKRKALIQEAKEQNK
jgi:hypothetical protein|tara:strand:+ start:1590 stop:1886 length:297 start_codon:yes stop_codon:yes gene_type:complete